MIEITAESRKLTGKKVRHLRQQDEVPASINFPYDPTLLIKIPRVEAQKLLRMQELEVVEVQIGDKKISTVVDSINLNPLNNKIVTINLSEITKDRFVKVDLPVRVSGISPAVKNNIGILVLANKSVRVRVRLDTLVPALEVEISQLTAVGDMIKVSDLDLPEGVKVDRSYDQELVLAMIAPPQKQLEEMLEEEAAAAGESGLIEEDEESEEEAGVPVEGTPEGEEGEEGEETVADGTTEEEPETVAG